MAEIEFINVKKTFSNNDHVIKDLNLKINDNEFFVIVGPSGCGKSTILRMIAGLEKITSGIIKIKGKPINKLSPGKRNISMVFQNYALFPHLNVYDNIGFGLRVRKIKKDIRDKKITDVSKMLDLADHLEKKPSQLSGGQKQRVALGRAVVKEPDVFLFDEPLSNLDAKLRNIMREEIAKLHKRIKKTVLYVTHDQIEAITLANRICVLNKGKIEQIGTPNEIYNYPNSKYVASFFGTPQMNFIKAFIENSNANSFVKFKDGQKLLLSKRAVSEYKLRDKQSVFVGIRPAAFDIKKNEHDIFFDFKISFVELTGDNKNIKVYNDYIDNITLSISANKNIKENESIKIGTKKECIHLFNDNQKRISHAFDC